MLYCNQRLIRFIVLILLQVGASLTNQQFNTWQTEFIVNAYEQTLVFVCVCVWVGELMGEYQYLFLILHVLGVCEVIVPRAGKPSSFQTNSHVTRKPVFLFPAALSQVPSAATDAALSSCGLGSKPPKSAPFFFFVLLLGSPLDPAPGGGHGS